MALLHPLNEVIVQRSQGARGGEAQERLFFKEVIDDVCYLFVLFIFYPTEFFENLCFIKFKRENPDL